MAQLHLTKYYSSPFVLEKGKLARLSAILSRGDATAHRLSFSVHFKTGRQLNLSSLEEVLELYNSATNPIVALEVSAHINDAAVTLEFNSADLYNNVSLRILGGDNETANELYGALDEQVDRTVARNLFARVASSSFARSLISAVAAAVIISVIVALIHDTSPPQQPFEANLLSRARSATTDHEKLQILFEKTLHDLQPFAPPASHPAFTTRSLFIALPALIIVSVFLYALWTCYPVAVFAWGDGEQRFSNTLARRRTMWTVVIVATILGIISNLFVASLPAFR